MKYQFTTYRLHQLVMNGIYQEDPLTRISSFKLLHREDFFHNSVAPHWIVWILCKEKNSLFLLPCCPLMLPLCRRFRQLVVSSCGHNEFYLSDRSLPCLKFLCHLNNPRIPQRTCPRYRHVSGICPKNRFFGHVFATYPFREHVWC